MTQNKRPALEPQKVRIRTKLSRLPRRTSRGGDGADGAIKSRPGQGLDPTKECSRSAQVSGVHRILLLLYTGILSDRPTPAQPHEASDDVALGRQGTTHVRVPPR